MTDNSNSIVPVNGGLMPAMSIQSAVARYNAVVEFTKTIMKDGKDFGTIPGAGTKPTLLKPGAEKLCSLFGLAPEFTAADKIIDFEKPLFYIQYECRLYRNSELVGTGLGSCNSMEKKYRYRQAERVCPNCHKATIIKGKAEYGGGWICFAKKGGCGAKFDDNAPQIVDQQTGQVENPDTADLLNTIDKMAQKRALVAATLIATNASEFFTQDIEDMGYVDAVYSDAPAAQQKSAQPEQPRWSPPVPQEAAPAPLVYDDTLPAITPEAAAEVINSKGVKYGDIDSDTLAHMGRSIRKLITEGRATDEHLLKLSAIQTILDSRDNGAQ